MYKIIIFPPTHSISNIFSSAHATNGLSLMLLDWHYGSDFIDSWRIQTESFSLNLLDCCGSAESHSSDNVNLRDLLLSHTRLIAIWSFLYFTGNFRLWFVDHRKSFFFHVEFSIFFFFFLVVLLTSFYLVSNFYKQLKNRDENNFTRLENEVWW